MSPKPTRASSNAVQLACTALDCGLIGQLWGAQFLIVCGTAVQLTSLVDFNNPGVVVVVVSF